MSFRRYSLGNSIARGFGYAAGFVLFAFGFGLIRGMTVGLWRWTRQINPVARGIVRTTLIAV